MHNISFDALGTRWNITVWSCPMEGYAHLQEEIKKQVHAFEQLFSRFIKTSYIQSLTHTTGTQESPLDFIEMLVLYKKLYTCSQKKFTPLIGSVLQSIGYDDTYSFENAGAVCQPPDFDSAVHIVNNHTITLHEPVQFDVGAIGKGYLVDKISGYVRACGYTQFLVDAGGDLFYQGNETIRVGLEHPDDAKKAIGVLELSAGSLCGSACNKRTWGDYSHIIDPQSLDSPKHIRATWVMAHSAALADGLATCLFLAHPNYFQKEFSFEYCMVDEEYAIKNSAGFLAEFF
jgi:thiamine biosynthesis lipoprotein